MKISPATTYTIVFGLSAYVQALAVPTSSETFLSRSTTQDGIRAFDTNLHLQPRSPPDSAGLWKRGSSGRPSRDRDGSPKSSKKTRLCRRGQGCTKERKKKDKGKQPAIELGGISSVDQPEGSREPSPASESLEQPYLSRGTIKARLDVVSARFAKKNPGETMEGIVMGSAAGTVLSGGREAQDVDIISSDRGSSAYVGFWEAQKWASDANKWHPHWANNAPQKHLSKGQIARIESRAKEQDQRVYSRNGVELLAAPWDYQLASKITRLSGPNYKPTDSRDVASDLHQMFATEGKWTISARGIQRRLDFYGLTKSGDTSFKTILTRINKKYRQEYNVNEDVITGVREL